MITYGRPHQAVRAAISYELDQHEDFQTTKSAVLSSVEVDLDSRDVVLACDMVIYSPGVRVSPLFAIEIKTWNEKPRRDGKVFASLERLQSMHEAQFKALQHKIAQVWCVVVVYFGGRMLEQVEHVPYEELMTFDASIYVGRRGDGRGRVVSGQLGSLLRVMWPFMRAAIERTDGEEVGERIEIDVEGAEQIARQKAACGL